MHCKRQHSSDSCRCHNLLQRAHDGHRCQQRKQPRHRLAGESENINSFGADKKSHYGSYRELER